MDESSQWSLLEIRYLVLEHNEAYHKNNIFCNKYIIVWFEYCKVAYGGFLTDSLSEMFNCEKPQKL